MNIYAGLDCCRVMPKWADEKELNSFQTKGIFDDDSEKISQNGQYFIQFGAEKGKLATIDPKNVPACSDFTHHFVTTALEYRYDEKPMLIPGDLLMCKYIGEHGESLGKPT